MDLQLQASLDAIRHFVDANKKFQIILDPVHFTQRLPHEIESLILQESYSRLARFFVYEIVEWHTPLQIFVNGKQLFDTLYAFEGGYFFDQFYKALLRIISGEKEVLARIGSEFEINFKREDRDSLLLYFASEIMPGIVISEIIPFHECVEQVLCAGKEYKDMMMRLAKKYDSDPRLAEQVLVAKQSPDYETLESIVEGNIPDGKELAIAWEEYKKRS